MDGFKEIEGFNGAYLIDRTGRVFSRLRGRFLVHQKHQQGYVFLTLGPRHERSGYLIHRLVALTFIPNPDNKEFVNHKNGIKTDNRVENLEWVTRIENERHAVSIGLKSSVGENNNMAVLSNRQVDEIRMLCKTNKRTDVAKMFNVSIAQVCRIANYKSRVA